MKKGLLEYLIVIGSWAEYIYEVSKYFEGFKSNLKTRDIDLLIKNLYLPREKVDIIMIFENEGFVTSIDPSTGITKFYKNSQIEVEFLAKEMGAGQIEPYDAPTLGIKVEGLRGLNLLEEHSMVVVAEGYAIRVPIPQVYILHKILINDQRGSKREKDAKAIENLLNIVQENSQQIEILKEIYLGLTKKQKAKIDAYCKINVIKLFPRHW